MDGKYNIWYDACVLQLTLGVTRRDPHNMPCMPCRPMEVADAWIVTAGREYHTGAAPNLGHLLPVIATRERRRREENKARSEVIGTIEKSRGWVRAGGSSVAGIPTITVNGPTPQVKDPIQGYTLAPFLTPRDPHYDLFTYEPMRPIPPPESNPLALHPSHTRGPSAPFLEVRPGTTLGFWREGSKVTVFHAGIPKHTLETTGRRLWAMVGLEHVEVVSVLQFLVLSPELQTANNLMKTHNNLHVQKN